MSGIKGEELRRIDCEIGLVGINTSQRIDEVKREEGDWERIPIKVDSGAVDTVMPRGMARHFEVHKTNRSQQGPGFKAANGATNPLGGALQSPRYCTY